MSNDADLPLSGLRVLDLTQNLPGPYATFLMACWGADVIKLEPPKGDPARSIRPFFEMVNRGKRSVVLDLRDEQSRPLLDALIEASDVIVEGFRPGVVERLGCDYDRARHLRPDIVYCSISAYGQAGPRRLEPAHDLNIQALAGVCDMERDASGTPSRSMLPIADLSSSLLAVSGICAALTKRERSGEGTYLDVAMADGVLSWANVWGRGVDLAGGAQRQLRDAPIKAFLLRPLLGQLRREKLYAMPHYDVFEAGDGQWLSIGIVDENHFWKPLCDELGLSRLRGLPLPMRIAAGPLLKRWVARALRRRSRDEWLRRFERAQVPASPVLSPDEAVMEPQVQARPMWSSDGWFGSPLPGSATPRASAPARGEHTQEVIEELGLG